MISYSPLHQTLEEKGLNISSMRDNGIHPTTIALINKGDYISLEKVDEICSLLNVPIEKVIQHISK